MEEPAAVLNLADPDPQVRGAPSSFARRVARALRN
jgi:hypothetical protein